MIHKNIDGIEVSIKNNEITLYINKSMTGIQLVEWTRTNHTEYEDFKEANIKDYERLDRLEEDMLNNNRGIGVKYTRNKNQVYKEHENFKQKL